MAGFDVFMQGRLAELLERVESEALNLDHALEQNPTGAFKAALVRRRVGLEEYRKRLRELHNRVEVLR